MQVTSIPGIAVVGQGSIVLDEGNGVREHLYVVEIGPVAAQHLLDRNTHNRNLSKSNLSLIGGELAQGRWEFTGAPIVISDTDVLLDGQHRLVEVVRTKVSIVTTLLLGLPEARHVIIDVGTSRTRSDILTLNGVANAHNMAALVCRVIKIEKYGMDLRRSVVTSSREAPVSNGEIEAYAIHPDIGSHLASCYAKGRSLQPFGLSASLSGTLFYVLEKVDADDATLFFEEVISGANLAADSPTLAVRSYLARRMAAPKRQRSSDVERMAVIIKNWNLWRNGQPAKKTQSFRGDEPFPEPV